MPGHASTFLSNRNNLRVRLGRRVHASLVGATVAALLIVLSASTAFAQNTTITAAWDRNTDAATAGYIVYYGTASGNYQWSHDAGNQVSTLLTLTPGSTYYVSVRAYNTSAMPGPPSNEATINLGSAAAPTAQITASMQTATTAVVAWQTGNAVGAAINGLAVPLSGSATVPVSATTTFTIVATSAGGATATHSATATVTSPTVPSVPTGMSATVTNAAATLSWVAPAAGAAPDRYLLDVGTSSGAANLLNGYSVGNVLTVAGDLPKGRYYARVRAANGFGMSGSSNEVSFRVGRTLDTPRGLAVEWIGSTAVLTWSAPADLSVENRPTSYVVEAGTAPGAANIASVSVGNVTTVRADIPVGTYYVRVRAENAFGDSDPTADLVLVARGAPDAPTSLTSVVSGATVELKWSPPSGALAESYVIEAGSAPGLSNLGVGNIGSATRFSAAIPPGTYYVRVRAVNARGAGPVSNEVIVTR